MITGTRSVAGVPLAQKQARDRRRRRRKQNRKRPSDAEASATELAQSATLKTSAPEGSLRRYKKDATVIGFNNRPKPYADLAKRPEFSARQPSQRSGRRPPRVDIRA
jgi:hypothetical protein